MSHHVSASPSNPTGAVEVVRTSSSAATTAPVDTGSVTTSSQPISTAVGGSAAPAAGLSGTPGANLPVPDIEQASSTIQGARADLSRTAGAERRLDRFDLVGGGGGGGGGEAQAGVADEGATDAVAAATEDKDVSASGAGGARMEMGEQAELNTTADQGSNQAAVEAATDQQLGNAQAISATGAEQGAVADGLPQTEDRANDVIGTV
jgi:hypothetical protein